MSIFIFTTLNGLFTLKHSLNEFYKGQAEGKQATYTSTQFDILSMRDHNTTCFTDDNKKEHSITSNERYYIPSEITSMLKQLGGFTAIEFFGAHLGAFSRKDLLSDEDFEMLVVSKKQCTDQDLLNRYTSLVKQQHIDGAYRIIITFLRSLQQKLAMNYPEAKVTDVYQGYLDMSYVAVITPQLQVHNLKLALVYVHAEGCIQAWLSAKNRTIQMEYREYFRSRLPPNSCTLVEQGPGG